MSYVTRQFKKRILEEMEKNGKDFWDLGIATGIPVPKLKALLDADNITLNTCDTIASALGVHMAIVFIDERTAARVIDLETHTAAEYLRKIASGDIDDDV